MKADYGWVIFIIIGIVLFLAWPTLKSLFASTSDKLTNKDMYDQGKAIFFDDEIWPAGAPGKSCATCHAPGYEPPAGVQIEMEEYRKGEPYILSGLVQKYGSNMMSSDDDLYRIVHRCLTSPTRMLTGGMPRDKAEMEALLFYLRREYK